MRGKINSKESGSGGGGFEGGGGRVGVDVNLGTSCLSLKYKFFGLGSLVDLDLYSLSAWVFGSTLEFIWLDGCSRDGVGVRPKLEPLCHLEGVGIS